jgi:hypothetical protein
MPPFELALAEGKRPGQHVGMLWQEEAAFDGIYTQPKVLAAIYHVLGRSFKTGPPVGRDPTPGHGLQALHPDWGRAASEPFHVVTVLWLLDDFTPNNGFTRLVPGSHRVSRPPKALLQPERRHPDEQRVVAEAGSALLFNAHVLHGSMRNQSGQRRRVLQCQFAPAIRGCRTSQRWSCLRGCRRRRGIFWEKTRAKMRSRELQQTAKTQLGRDATAYVPAI